MASVDQILNGTTGRDNKNNEKTASIDQVKKLNEDVSPQMIS
jgi:hypothetical protein